MSDSRGSPIPHDRVRENVDTAQVAEDAKREERRRERALKDRGVNERQDDDDQPAGRGEGGD